MLQRKCNGVLGDNGFASRSVCRHKNILALFQVKNSLFLESVELKVPLNSRNKNYYITAKKDTNPTTHTVYCWHHNRSLQSTKSHQTIHIWNIFMGQKASPGEITKSCDCFNGQKQKLTWQCTCYLLTWYMRLVTVTGPGYDLKLPTPSDFSTTSWH